MNQFNSIHDSLRNAQQRIAAAYDPARFAADGKVAVGEIAQYLARSQRCEGRVLNWEMPAANLQAAANMLDDCKDPGALLHAALARGQTIQDPRFIGHQVAAPVPLAALFEAASSIANQGMTVYEMGPWSTAVERVMLDRLGRQLGLAESFGGVLTSGGSLANLTALLTARNAVNPDAWKNGAGGGTDVILSSPESHYSVERAAGILGIGANACMRVGATPDGKIDPQQLRKQIVQLRETGRRVIAVVASACTTRTGVFDPLQDIAAVCAETGVWLHVDAAHGGAAAFSPRYAHYLDGIDQADSVVWDAHKMMFIPALSTYLFYKRKNDQYRTLNQEAPYLFDSNAERVEAYNTGLGTIECTKRAAALSLWGVWAVYGPQFFTDLVEVTFGMARRIATLIREADDLELLHEPEANIILFRYVPAALRHAGARELGAFQQEMRKKLVESGEGYIVPAMDGGTEALRMAVMNPLTREEHFQMLLDTLRRFGKQHL
jgi:L-2,4-diaminobutyrate decarboxylase